MTSTVFGIGMASLFSDLSHEAVTAVLPALLASMGVAAGVLGTIEGVADGLSSAAKLYGGWWTDRRVGFGFSFVLMVTGSIVVWTMRNSTSKTSAARLAR